MRTLASLAFAAIFLASFPALLWAAIWGNRRELIAVALVSYVAQIVVYVWNRPLVGAMRRTRLDPAPFFLREVLFLLYVARALPLNTTDAFLLGAGVLALHLARFGHEYILRRVGAFGAPPVETRNLAYEAVPPTPSLLRSLFDPGREGFQRWLMSADGGPKFLYLDAVLFFAFITGSASLFRITAWTFVGLFAILAAIAVGLRAGSARERLSFGELFLQAPLQAVERMQPDIAVYFSGGADSAYQINMWLRTLEELDLNLVIFLRERRIMRELGETTLPVLCVPDAANFSRFIVPSIKVALYPANVGKNIHMLRAPGVEHVFIGHGDSDKNASANPFTRVYDAVFVAGQAGIDRYRRARVPISDEQFFIVGRPQLSVIEPGGPVDAKNMTVLYAPTWEGWFTDQNYTSLELMGAQICRRLVAQGVRVIFKPHPMTGAARGEMRAVVREVARILEADKTRGHQVILGPEPHLYDCFNRADLLITDVSSVVSDFVASQKPYVVCDPQQVGEEAFHDGFPSTRAAYLLDRGCTQLDAILRDVATTDSKAQARAALKEYLLGPADLDPMKALREAILRLAEESDELARDPEHVSG